MEQDFHHLLECENILSMDLIKCTEELTLQAPMGTPIMASGDGVVKKAAWCGGGGNCVVIRHNSTYQTVYAHMKNFAKGIRSGVRVKQGQVIGYVGSTENQPVHIYTMKL